MVARNTSPLKHGARNTVSGLISNGATWYETIDIQLNGITDPDTLTWEMTFQKDYGGSSDLTLTTEDSTITVTDDGDGTATMVINAPPASLSALSGDYFCNLKSTDPSDDRVIHWAFGSVTFHESPPA